ncbi:MULTISPECIES: glycosyltransferase family 4 protein [Mesonia]|uniref:Glycogen synthase n=1 Tax=Mesonia oceanica TaxID=2687242 RepID=A0AC61Y9Z3_9FLAO|nr:MULTISPECIES: glycosyltransferase family 4 protein [Mesonia]MAN26662.1 glycosyl transferase family 1 [Mesonia sp.]MAQ40061.1 glycosyl transferase family 1 [Mesonia sp.]MBJ96637.1 glycosyl transferase family 1 [Flavobacteriaceae bacterium]VVV01331.1 Glycogen synthase [Mesonia oceanica]|tara:strand:- start:15609 stop:16643 length:1035 start_codon:yes stop_codon:yes gene_type:complete
MKKKQKKYHRKILYLGNKLAKHGKTLTAIEFLAPKLQEENYEVIAVSDKKNKVLRMFVMLSAVMLRGRYVDFLLIDTYSTANFWYAYLSAKIARKKQLPYLCILHGGDLPKRLVHSKKQSQELFGNAKMNIAPSAYLMNVFQEAGYRKLTYIPNPIDLAQYTFEKRVFTLPKLLWVRSFSEIYNPQLAILILEELKKDYPQAELCMIGPDKDGSLEKCKQLAAHKNLRIKFTGKLSKKEWIKLSKEYNFFINTTNFDNTPISVIEAMALGLPVISTNVGGLPYLISDREDGILVEKEQVVPFVREIKALINDPMFANQLATKARQKVKQFDWKVVKEEWKAVLQ